MQTFKFAENGKAKGSTFREKTRKYAFSRSGDSFILAGRGEGISASVCVGLWQSTLFINVDQPP